VAQADAWQHQYVGTEHLLYGLAREHGSNFILLLEVLGIAPDMVQAEIVQLLTKGTLSQ
jgi:ATP-dependent Clp protease ATP-binding subunit ClpA